MIEILCYWCSTSVGVRLWFGRPLCPKCKDGEETLYERD